MAHLRADATWDDLALRPTLPRPPAAHEVSAVSRGHSDLTWKQEGDWRMIVRKGKVENGNSG